MGRRHTTGGRKGVLYYLGLGFGGVVFALVVLFGIVAIALPAFGQATPMTVLTNSMEPQLPPGTLVVAKPVAPAAIRADDVITYRVKPHEPAVVTHRVVEVIHAPDGTVSFRTKGDHSAVADAAPVKSVQVVGRLWYSIPWVGYVNSLVGQQRGWLALLVAVAVILYAGYLFRAGAAALFQKRRTRAVLTEPLDPIDPVSGPESVDNADGDAHQ